MAGRRCAKLKPSQRDKKPATAPLIIAARWQFRDNRDMDEPAPIDPAATAHRVDRLTRLLGLGALALLGVTWKLWTPQNVFPRVPLLYWAPPHWLDWTSIAVVVVGLLGLIVHRRVPERRTAAGLAAGGFALQFLADQHRLQPWAWQFFILALVIALADDRSILVGWRWLVISIYAYSALSKLDYAFTRNVGTLLTEQYWQLRNLSPAFAKPTPLVYSLQTYAPFFLPVGELLVAILLWRPRTRRYGLWGSWLMHLGLLGLLGPFGLNHSFGVLLWNAFFVFQNWMLFGDRFVDAGNRQPKSCRHIAERANLVARGVLVIAYIWPALYPLGLCDAWIGWAVYSAPFERVSIWLNRESADSLRQSGNDALSRSLRGPGFDNTSVK
ncbi:MAG: hypothetical protein B7Z55_06820, partial [Planctomycetales bacterium 12-60-4]